MENNIYNKKQSNIMIKKLFTIFTLLFISLTMSNVYGQVIYNDDQSETTENYDIGSIIASSNPSLLFGNGSDITENFQLTTTPMYVLFSAGSGQSSENITISYYDTVFEDFVSKNYTIDQNETFIIELTPQNVGDKTSLILSDATGSIFYTYVFKHDSLRDSKTSVFTPLISGVVELIDINLTLWRAGFYLIIFLVVAGLVIGLFAGAFYLIKKTKDLNEGEGFISSHTRK
jgi:hypothetical protein